MPVEIVHRINGRVRLRVPRVKEEPEYITELQTRLTGLPGVETIRVNPTVSSVVIGYDGAREETFWTALTELFPQLQNDARSDSEESPKAAGPFGLGATATGAGLDSAGAEIIARLFRQLNKDVESRTGGIDLKALIPVGLTAFGLLSLLRSALLKRKIPLPEWYDFLWFALGTFFMFNQPKQTTAASKAHEGRNRDSGNSQPASNAKSEDVESDLSSRKTEQAVKPIVRSFADKTAAG